MSISIFCIKCKILVHFHASIPLEVCTVSNTNSSHSRVITLDSRLIMSNTFSFSGKLLKKQEQE